MPTSRSGYDVTRLSDERVAEFARGLSDEERAVILHQGTERAFCGALLDNHHAGTYCCRLCSLPLFKSDAKFESGTGWPSFAAAFDPDHIVNLEDHDHGMRRVEIRCARCDAHLGHVFNDGPPPTHLRYCLNSIAMQFIDDGQPLTPRP